MIKSFNGSHLEICQWFSDVPGVETPYEETDYQCLCYVEDGSIHSMCLYRDSEILRMGTLPEYHKTGCLQEILDVLSDLYLHVTWNNASCNLSEEYWSEVGAQKLGERGHWSYE